MTAAASQLLFFAVLAVAMWLLLLRPQRRRAQAVQEARSAVAIGNSVITTAGLHATVTAIEDETLLLEIAPGVQARFARQAVVRVLDPAETTLEPVDAVAQQGAPPAA